MDGLNQYSCIVIAPNKNYAPYIEKITKKIRFYIEHDRTVQPLYIAETYLEIFEYKKYKFLNPGKEFDSIFIEESNTSNKYKDITLLLENIDFAIVLMERDHLIIREAIHYMYRKNTPMLLLSSLESEFQMDFGYAISLFRTLPNWVNRYNFNNFEEVFKNGFFSILEFLGRKT